MKLTVPQILYLIRAMKIDAYGHRGVYFSLWVPGRTDVGRRMLAKGLIETIFRTVNCPFQVSDTGVSVYLNLPVDVRVERKPPTEFIVPAHLLERGAGA